MSKLTKKFMISLSIILISVVFLSLYLNINFIQRFFLYQEKQEMNQICDQLISSKEELSQTIHKIEAAEDVIIVLTENTEDNVLLNERLKTAFLEKGISLNKYWLWEQDQQDTLKDGRKMRIYHQNKLHYSLLVKYLSWDTHFIAVAKIIPSVTRTLSLINQVTVIIFIGAGFVMFFLLSILVHKIIAPLKAIGDVAQSISNLEFKTIEIHTNDELEILAENINHMSRKLKETLTILEQKNKQMKELLSNVSHDLKTPISLIKAYTNGIKDGIDDGTFLDTIMIQNEHMEHIVERLLNLAKIQHQEKIMEHVDVSRCLKEVIQEYRLQAENQQLIFDCEIKEAVTITADKEAIQLIFSNLISNAVKYTDKKQIKIKLYQKTDHSIFQIQNNVADSSKIDIKKVWEPFYVAEKSRNKNMSGTGLGLSIVKAISDKYNFSYSCNLEQNKITFSIKF